MLDVLTPSQQMFMLFFSILYGIMLNSLMDLATFPIAQFLAGEDITGRDWNGEYVYSKINTARKRFLLSLGLLNFLPITYFALIFQSLSSIKTAPTVLQIFSLALLSLSVFAFPQFFQILVTYRKIRNHIYTPFIFRRIMDERGFHPKPEYHLLAGIIYLAIPLFMFAIVFF